MVVKPLLGNTKRENVFNSLPSTKNKEPLKSGLGDNYVGFQSLNITHLIPKDIIPGETQDLYTEEVDLTSSQGITDAN